MKTRRLLQVSLRMLAACCGVTSIVSCDPENVTAPVDEVTYPRVYDNLSIQSEYMTMRDGVRIAIDITRPAQIPPGVTIPAILEMTRYWRAIEGNGIGWRAAIAARRGYAYVAIDERGTGASFGTWPYPYSDTSLEDFREVVDWVVAQEWSNGRVGAFGISYPGLTAQLLPAMDHAAVRVSVPAFTQYDAFTDIGMPGGVFLEWFVKVWSDLTSGMDQNIWPFDVESHVKPVDADTDGSMLAAAIAEHLGNGNIYEHFKDVNYRDEPSHIGITVDDMSGHRYQDEIEESGVALYPWGSWMDHTSGHSVLTRFLTLDNVRQAVIGPWTHGGGDHASPYLPPGTDADPVDGTQWRETLNFMDGYLMSDTVVQREKVLHYYTLGAEEWKTASVWPIPGTTTEQWYFGANNSLSTTTPTASTGSDDYTVDFTTTTGDLTRWHTAMGTVVEYRDRSQEDQKLLTYTSDPLTEDTEITGYPIVTLRVSSTHPDGAFYVYLEDVDESGYVTYVTEGQLRALHRKVSSETPPYEMRIPYHTFKQADGEPMVPGEVTEITFGLLPTSVLIREGHRIRIAIAGHDAGLFARCPATGDPVITVERNSVYPSKIELPVVRR